MKWKEPEMVGDLINQLLKAEKLDGSMNEQRILNIWPQIVGPVINRCTIKRYIIKRVLYIHLSSAPLKSEINMHRSRLKQLLNETVGEEVITDIIIK
ncbi:MAG: DUF721 domain-containing protein [Bacteroidales bacterium]